MIASDCNVETFLNSLSGKDFYELIYAAEREAVSAERMIYQRSADLEQREKCGKEYAQLLKQFICFLRYGCRHRDIDSAIFDHFCSVKENACQYHPTPLRDRTKINSDMSSTI